MVIYKSGIFVTTCLFLFFEGGVCASGLGTCTDKEKYKLKDGGKYICNELKVWKPCISNGALESAYICEIPPTKLAGMGTWRKRGKTERIVGAVTGNNVVAKKAGDSMKKAKKKFK